MEATAAERKGRRNWVRSGDYMDEVPDGSKAWYGCEVAAQGQRTVERKPW